MREIWIPETVGSLFTLIYLIRPLFKSLRPLDGIAWFPLLALGVAAAVFPAYGFRPEYVPLLAYQAVTAALSLGPLLMGGRRSADLYNRGSFFSFFIIAGLVLFTALALWFAPLDLPSAEGRPVKVENRGRRYTLHIFEGRRPSRGLVFLVPPEFGGIKAVDSICAALGDRGFTVIGYTRRGLRSPAALAGLWSSFRRGTVLKKANAAGRALEEEKRREIEFILPYVRENLGTLAPGAEGGAFFLAGWGAGGSALYYLTAEYTAPSVGRFPSPGRAGPAGKENYGALGLVMVESRLWSSWEPAPAPAPPAPGENPVLGALRRLPARIMPERLGGPGEPESPGIPVLYLVSGRALEEKPARRDYAALFAALRNSSGPAALAVLEGAGPLDYSDFPAEYPLYRALFPGPPRAAGPAGAFPAAEAAALAARFYDLAAGASETPGPGGGLNPAANPGPAPAAARRNLHLETRYWNLGDLRLY
jgi:hypothetical protein